MLQRSKSNRSQRLRRPSNLNLKKSSAAAAAAAASNGASGVIIQNLDDVGNRHSDDDSSQSSAPLAAPVFASVHRTRHTGMSAIKRDGKPVPANAGPTMTTNAYGQMGTTAQQQQQRQSYQQYQQQRKLQQQQQHMKEQQQYHAQLQPQNDQTSASGMQKFAKTKAAGSHWLDGQQQQQHNRQTPQHSTSVVVAAQHRSQPQQQMHLYEANAQQKPNQRQHQQQQQQHAAATSNFNQISKTATHLLNDIYEKHLLNHTSFTENAQKQQQQQQQLQMQNVARLKQQQQLRANIRRTGIISELHFGNKPTQQQQQPQQQRPVHFLKLPPPPAVSPPPAPAPPLPLTHAVSNFGYPQHFQFSDAYVEPVDSTKQTAAAVESLHAHHQPPPPPAPLNHVYETIKERPKALPPPPPERKQPAPPLPPSRLLKKRQLPGGVAAPTATAVAVLRQQQQQRAAINNRKSLTAAEVHANEPPKQPPAYTATQSSISNAKQQQQQYKQQQQQQQPLHERTKADGEQRSYIYQQLRAQQQQQQHANSTSLQQQLQQQQQQLPPHNQTHTQREHPVGAAIDEQLLKNAIKDSNAKASPQHQPQQLSVEQTLQQAGLLQSQQHNAATAAAGSNANNLARPNALPIVFEEDTGEFQDVLVLEADGTAKLPYRHGKIEVRLETAQAMVAAAYYARAATKLAQSASAKVNQRSAAANSQGCIATSGAANSSQQALASLTDLTGTLSNNSEMPNTTTRNGGYCGALQRGPPPLPPGLARRLANKENYGIGKVKVMLRIADTHADSEKPHFMAIDKKKRQITLTDPAAAATVSASTTQERGPMVAAPKMFAFDSLFTAEDQQSDVCASALSEVIPAVLEGSDGCLLTIGYPSSGQRKTMLGGINPPSELGAIPCAISWLYKGINERRQKSGARFSVRVSALGVSATKPDTTAKDLLAAHATDSDDSPGVYLRDDFLGGPTELRAPTAERAALFLDAALAGRPQGGLEPAMIFTLHVYQYSLSRKGGVAGGRSRLHLIDLGGCANRSGGLPLSGIGNILLAILSGQRHPPNKDHPLTPLLKDCLAPLTCHVAIMAHIVHTQSHTDALTTIQLASRIHRMRRRKHRFPMPSDKTTPGMGLAASNINGGHQSTGSSAGSGADPSSSELSADTVIYMGPSDDATDGEHPPVYLPSLSSGDNRGVMSKVLKGSGVEKQQPQQSKLPGVAKKAATQKAPQSPVVNRNGSLKRNHANSPTPTAPTSQPTSVTTNGVTNEQQPQQFFSPVHSPKIVAGSLRHPNMTMMCSKGSNVPSPKGSPLRRPGVGGISAANAAAETGECPGSPLRKLTEEQWIDGPRVSRAKVAEARHLLREVNHVKQCETWIDGPKSQSTRSLTAGNLPNASSHVQGYGFMDAHKKTMIRQWVENQTSQVFQTASAGSSPTHAHREQQAQHLRNITYHMSQLKQKSLDAPEELYATTTRQQQRQLLQQQQQAQADQHSLRSSQLELVNPLNAGLTTAISITNASAPAEIRSGASQFRQHSQTLPHSSTTRHHQQVTSQTNDETEHGYGAVGMGMGIGLSALSDNGHERVAAGGGGGSGGDNDEDQDSGPSEVPPALPLIEPLGSREISHESLHRILSRHVSRESLYQQQQSQQQQQLNLEQQRRQEELLHSVALAAARQQQQQQNSSPHHQQQAHHYSQHSMSDCGLQVTEEEIARTMAGEHPLAALSHCENMSIVSSFHMAGDAFSDCAMGERTRNQFDQLARLREIFTSQLAMAEVTPVFRSGCDVGSVYSEPAYRFNTGPGSVCSEPPYRPPSPKQLSRSPSQGSLPSLNGIMQIAGMEQYASLRHPDGASDPNLPKLERAFVMEHEDITEVDEKSALLSPSSKRPSLSAADDEDARAAADVLEATSVLQHLNATLPQAQLPLLPLNTHHNTTTADAYDSGHDSSTPRTSKHSGISRRAESGYHSVATARDSDESSFTSGLSKEHHNRITATTTATVNTIVTTKKKRQDKGLCTWLMNPFTCTYPETEGEISDF